MATIKIDPTSLAEAKAFYQEELQKTLGRLNHIQSMLNQLGDSGMSIEINAPGVKSTSKTPRKAGSSTSKRKKGKPGPKSKWDKMILSILKTEDRPFDYDELTHALMIASGRSLSQRAKTKSTVQNTVFKLRGSKKIDTFSKGGRQKYIALSDWFTAPGEVKEEYAAKVPDHVKKTPVKKSSGRGPGRPRKHPLPEAAVVAPKKTTSPKKKTASSRKKSSAKKTPVKTTASTAAAPAPKAAPKKKAASKSRAVKKAPSKKASSAKKTSTAKKATSAKKTKPAKKATPAKKTSTRAKAPRKTPSRGLSQAKGADLPEPKK